MSLTLMSHLADAYGWSRIDLASFSGGEVLQIARNLSKKQKELEKQGFNSYCPMMRVLTGIK